MMKKKITSESGSISQKIFGHFHVKETHDKISAKGRIENAVDIKAL
tara:strand:+ start:651 stop:788 length:138 start_codon:yes stop_codon:yes gene_type:complete